MKTKKVFLVVFVLFLSVVLTWAAMQQINLFGQMVLELWS